MFTKRPKTVRVFFQAKKNVKSRFVFNLFLRADAGIPLSEMASGVAMGLVTRNQFQHTFLFFFVIFILFAFLVAELL
jgi:hypothetical protein